MKRNRMTPLILILVSHDFKHEGNYMKISNSYHINLGARAGKTFLQKIFGSGKTADTDPNEGSASITIDGEIACEYSVEELKELFNESSSSWDKTRDYIKSGNLKSDTAAVIDAIMSGASQMYDGYRDLYKKVEKDDAADAAERKAAARKEEEEEEKSSKAKK